MARRHPALPTRWLMTDERQGDALWPALAALPRGSGVVFRHHRTPPKARRALLQRVGRVARRHGLVLACEVETRDRVHVVLQQRYAPDLDNSSVLGRVHCLRDAVAARRRGAIAIFVSPVFPTRTHPDATSLGPLRAAAIARHATIPTIALGGMTAHRFTQIRALGFAGWAAIDGLTPIPRQKRNAVPI